MISLSIYPSVHVLEVKTLYLLSRFGPVPGCRSITKCSRGVDVARRTSARVIDVQPPGMESRHSAHSQCAFVSDPDHRIPRTPISSVSRLETVAHHSVFTLVINAVRLDAVKGRLEAEILQVPNGCISRSDSRRRRWPWADVQSHHYPRVTRQIFNPRCPSPGLKSGLINGICFNHRSVYFVTKRLRNNVRAARYYLRTRGVRDWEPGHRDSVYNWWFYASGVDGAVRLIMYFSLSLGRELVMIFSSIRSGRGLPDA